MLTEANFAAFAGCKQAEFNEKRWKNHRKNGAAEMLNSLLQGMDYIIDTMLCESNSSRITKGLELLKKSVELEQNVVNAIGETLDQITELTAEIEALNPQ